MAYNDITMLYIYIKMYAYQIVITSYTCVCNVCIGLYRLV